jgi:hypothetical protein
MAIWYKRALPQSRAGGKRREEPLKRLLAIMAALVAGLALPVAPAAAGTAPSLTITPHDEFAFCRGNNAHVVQYDITNEGGSATGKLSVDLSYWADSLGQGLVLTKDSCTGRSLGPWKKCLIEISWTPGPDTIADLTVASKKAELSVEGLFGTVVP